MSTFSTSIAANNDDKNGWNTSLLNGNTYIGMGVDSGFQYGAYFRFLNVTIANASTITAASVTFMAFDSRSTSHTETIGFEDSDNPGQVTTKADADGRALTASTTSWTPAAWTGGSTYATDDCASSLQTVVNRAGFASGNAVMFIARNASGTGNRYAHEYESATANSEASISITYTAPASGQPTGLRGALCGSFAGIRSLGRESTQGI